YLSIPFADGETAKAFEPQAPPPGRRFEAVRRLSEAGIPVGVFVAPIIPGVTDRDIPEILRRAADAGARSATYTPLRLPTSVQSVFIDRLQEAMPLRAKKVIGMIRAMRGGSLDDARFGHRMRGSGPYWESIRRLFSVCRQKYGLDESLDPFAAGGKRPSSSRGGCRDRSDAPSAQMSFDFVA
ncbi:MAG: radical SAM protein, partial [Planctomycetes bacterium]|nr:radical SAM protein [Planctomycetota bacterium]